MTPADVEYIERQYAGIAQIATARRERWRRVRLKMWAEDTIGSSIDAGRLRVDELLATGVGSPLIAEGDPELAS